MSHFFKNSVDQGWQPCFNLRAEPLAPTGVPRLHTKHDDGRERVIQSARQCQDLCQPGMVKRELFSRLDQMDLIRSKTYELPWDGLPRSKLLRTAELSSIYDDDPVPSLHHVEQVEPTRSPVQRLHSLRKSAILQFLNDAWSHTVVPTQRIPQAQDENDGVRVPAPRVSSFTHTNFTVKTCAEQEMQGS